jgi:NAD(P)-dependent dehydrogenase (short-subunit alcohol dehydrogenase family)
MPNILITGTNRGIGLALVKAFVAKGYQVIAAVRDPAKMETVEGVIVLKLESASPDDAKAVGGLSGSMS